VRVAYLVLSHSNPAQVLRLVAALKEGPGAEVAVRHDQRRSALDRTAVERLGARLLRDDIDFEWGGTTQLDVLLGALERVAEAFDPDWLFVLSGQDYPLRPIEAIHADLAASGVDAMLGSVWPLETRHRPAPPQEEFFLRYAYRHYRVPRRTPHLPQALRSVAYLRELPTSRHLGVRRMRLPFGESFRCYVSSDWITLGRRGLSALLSATRENSRLLRYYGRTAIPSESFPATVLLNDRSLNVSRDHRRFAPFTDPGAAHPDALTSADLDRILASGCDFARKFDAEVDAKVLDALDESRSAAAPR
jgi:hypothetical protein